jgi:hypothetical protein
VLPPLAAPRLLLLLLLQLAPQLLQLGRLGRAPWLRGRRRLLVRVLLGVVVMLRRLVPPLPQRDLCI